MFISTNAREMLHICGLSVEYTRNRHYYRAIVSEILTAVYSSLPARGKTYILNGRFCRHTRAPCSCRVCCFKRLETGARTKVDGESASPVRREIRPPKHITTQRPTSHLPNTITTTHTRAHACAHIVYTIRFR